MACIKAESHAVWSRTNLDHANTFQSVTLSPMYQQRCNYVGPSKKLRKDVRGVSLPNEMTRSLLSVGAALAWSWWQLAISVIRNEPQALTAPPASAGSPTLLAQVGSSTTRIRRARQQTLDGHSQPPISIDGHSQPNPRWTLSMAKSSMDTLTPTSIDADNKQPY